MSVPWFCTPKISREDDKTSWYKLHGCIPQALDLPVPWSLTPGLQSCKNKMKQQQQQKHVLLKLPSLCYSVSAAQTGIGHHNCKGRWNKAITKIQERGELVSLSFITVTKCWLKCNSLQKMHKCKWWIVYIHWGHGTNIYYVPTTCQAMGLISSRVINTKTGNQNF